jgi:hypothetical protein
MLLTVEAIYKSACASYSRAPHPDQCLAWESVLRGYHFDEIKNALSDWQADTTPEFDGKPRGTRFPMPADLAANICKHRRVITSTREFHCCAKCQDGWLRLFNGTTVGGMAVDAKVEAVRRCECFLDHLAAHFGVTRTELPAKLAERKREREKRKVA